MNQGKTNEMCLEMSSYLADNCIVLFVHFVSSFSFNWEDTITHLGSGFW